MIFVSHALPVNVPDEPRLTPANVWDGLVLKANNALPFVPAMTYCEVTHRHSDTVFDRDIEDSLAPHRADQRAGGKANRRDENKMYSEPGDTNALRNHLRILLQKIMKETKISYQLS